MNLTRRHSDCNDGTCPAIWDTSDAAMVGIQGATLTDPEALADLGRIPGHEGVVLIPRELLKSYFSKERP